MYMKYFAIILKINLILSTSGEFRQKNLIGDNLQDANFPYKFSQRAVLSERILTNDQTNNRHQDIDLLPSSSKPLQDMEIDNAVISNPALAAVLLNSVLGIRSDAASSFNHQQHLPTNPYVALLLSHYGKYMPIFGTGRGIYGYNAANNYHNNKPFGAYKIYQDEDA